MTISKLVDDLLVEILIRSFPNPSSACRSQSVCKRWKAVISSPRFNRRFVSHHQSTNNEPKPPVLVATNDPESVVRGFVPTPSINRVGGPEHFTDLLLCGFAEAGGIRSHHEIFRSYLLCNPFTKQWAALPLAPERPVGYEKLVVSLACQRRSSGGSVSNYIDLDYRFRVVCTYQHVNSIKLDVFCSETGEWTKEALVLDGVLRYQRTNVVSCNGVVFLPYRRAQKNEVYYEPFIAAIDPFRLLDAPPTSIDVTTPLSGGKRWWNISVSKGALHMIVCEDGTGPKGARIVLSVWRLDEEDDGTMIWRKVCDGPVKLGNYRLQGLCFVAALHPQKPEVVFFNHWASDPECGQLSCNLGTGGEMEFVAELQVFPGWRMFQLQPKISGWDTPILKYQVMYDGSYSCWAQSKRR
ncbi:unnamed protein product [Linum tenue]|uniref:F-box protein At3g26010-like beta-propeller domain-containing protein n=1 Tax=Linum tenue TaxID=586396 RepID=A0AAV0PGC5_9ROSI|nr:unnamed protein product [Linum tenue]